jgi:hypothetical protein
LFLTAGAFSSEVDTGSRSSGFAGWIGAVAVIQNVTSSLFNSHLFDFAEGWLYVVGVGVAGGAILRHTPALSPEREMQKPKKVHRS